jgi:hypothetical protein
MAREFRGDAEKLRRASETNAARSLGVNPRRWTHAETAAFANYALVLDLLPDLSRWTEEEKLALVDIVRAKAGPRESRYLQRMQTHARLRDAVLVLGSR